MLLLGHFTVDDHRHPPAEEIVAFASVEQAANRLRGRVYDEKQKDLKLNLWAIDSDGQIQDAIQSLAHTPDQHPDYLLTMGQRWSVRVEELAATR